MKQVRKLNINFFRQARVSQFDSVIHKLESCAIFFRRIFINCSLKPLVNAGVRKFHGFEKLTGNLFPLLRVEIIGK